MDKGSLKITYYAFNGVSGVEDFENIDLFESYISKSYTSIVKPIVVGRGGGAYQFFVDFFVNLHAHDYFKFIEGYLAGKLIDKIANPVLDSYIFNPLKKAYKKLKESNPILDCYLFTIELIDTKIFIYSIFPNSIIDNKDKILMFLNKNYELLIINGEFPIEIHIPVYDEEINGKLIYRPPLGEDERIDSANKNNYFKSWGLRYQSSGKSIVYDVENKAILMDQEFMNELEYGFYYRDNKI